VNESGGELARECDLCKEFWRRTRAMNRKVEKRGEEKIIPLKVARAVGRASPR
jgi:hypothetical protein